MRLASGLVCQFNVSRISQRKVRTMQVTMADSVLDADLFMRTVSISRDTTGELVDDGSKRFRQRTVTDVPWVGVGGEPLLLELQDFLQAVTHGTEVLVDGEQGVRAVELCELVALAASGPDSTVTVPSQHSASAPSAGV
jgi:predicted dehydrogenase